MPDFDPAPGDIPMSEMYDRQEHAAYRESPYTRHFHRERERDYWRDQPPPRNQAQQQQDAPRPMDDATTGNRLRPQTFDEIIGQEEVITLLSDMVRNALARERPLGHVLLVGPSGTGKSTLAYVIARALGTQCYQLEAPISHDTLVALRGVMRDGDVLFLDEIHQQALGERRGRQAATQPEVLFSVMEDRRLPTATGVLEFPAITLIGATTDEGMLPDAFIGRFPIRPALRHYTEDELTQIAEYAADQLDVPIHYGAALAFARASRGVPREVNTYVTNAEALTDGAIDQALAERVLNLLGVTEDGLTRDMQAMLKFLYLKCERWVRDNVRYQASVNHVATGIGKSRDSKAIALRVEPYLIEKGYVGVAHGGRYLTDEGILRTIRLIATTEREAA